MLPRRDGQTRKDRTTQLLICEKLSLAIYLLELSDGKILTTMEWLMVFAKVPLYSMVFQWFSNMWTIGVNGFSMVFLHVNHWCQWFFNGFSDLKHWYQCFFQWFFYNGTITIEWMVCGSPLTSMAYQWFWWKWTVIHKKKAKTQRKHDF